MLEFMYRKIVLAFDESPEAKRALTRALELAQELKAELYVLTVSEPLPAYAAFIDSEIPGGRQQLLHGRNTFYSNLQESALQEATRRGIPVQCAIVEAAEVQGIADHISSWGADLLVIGRRHHSAMFPVWGGTVHNVAEKVRCSILAV